MLRGEGIPRQNRGRGVIVDREGEDYEVGLFGLGFDVWLGTLLSLKEEKGDPRKVRSSDGPGRGGRGSGQRQHIGLHQGDYWLSAWGRRQRKEQWCFDGR